MRAAADSNFRTLLWRSVFDLASIAGSAAVGLSLALVTFMMATSQCEPVAGTGCVNNVAVQLSDKPTGDR